MNIQQAIRCNVCNNQMQYLNHELTVIPVYKEGDTIGVNRKMKAVNVRFYCGYCRVNMSRPFPYSEQKYIRPFIDDIKNYSAKFENQEYITL